MEGCLRVILLALSISCIESGSDGVTADVNTTGPATISPSTTATPTARGTPLNTRYPPCNCTKDPVQPVPPLLGMMKVRWDKDKPCEGRVTLHVPSEGAAKPVCLESSYMSRKNLSEICRVGKCGQYLSQTSYSAWAYRIHDNVSVSNATCVALQTIICEDISGTRELVAYKTVTALLCILILAVIFLQFGRPTYTAIRKRMSKKRHNRWIGPTQSQSVCYNRGQAAMNPNNNTVKRQSFPGLERLTVNTSREPSSNRNSDYDSYN